MGGARNWRHRLREPCNRLDSRLLAALFLGGVAILGAAAGWHLHQERLHLTQLVGQSATSNVETMRRSTREAMLRNDPDEVHRILSAIGAQAGVERIRVIDRDGTVRMSTLPADVGEVLERSAEPCADCHRQEPPTASPESTLRQRVFHEAGGPRILGVASPILNEPDCSSASCHAHPSDQKVLGVLDVQLSLAAADEQLAASLRQLGLSLLLALGGVLVLVLLLVWRMVLRPVRILTRATRAVAAGDLQARCPVTSRDEMGEAATAWNRMVETLAQARSELERWSRELEARVAEKTKELEATHQRMLVVEKMASLGKLAAIVAHEINNPLSGIATYARLLRRRLAAGDEADPEDRRALELLDAEARHCGEIVRNLLGFARGTGARFAPEDLADLVRRGLLLVRHQADQQRVEVATEILDGLPPVWCDASQVQQIVVALAMNALEAMPDGGRLALRTGFDAQRGRVWIEVEDTGCGIPPEEQHRIFEPFYTTKNSGRGVGLGLSVVYGIVERHHGEVCVCSDVGAGTTFRVHLPVEQSAAVRVGA